MTQITNPDSQILNPAFLGMSNLNLIKKNMSIFAYQVPLWQSSQKMLPLLKEVHYDFTNKLSMSFMTLFFPMINF